VWGNDASAARLRAEFGGFDAVVAAGCTYHTGLLPALFRTVAGLLADGGRLYVCHARREHAPSIPRVNATKRAHAVHGFWRGSRRPAPRPRTARPARGSRAAHHPGSCHCGPPARRLPALRPQLSPAGSPAAPRAGPAAFWRGSRGPR
jgi:hypothetical protein